MRTKLIASEFVIEIICHQSKNQFIVDDFTAIFSMIRDDPNHRYQKELKSPTSNFIT